ncbi:hypothetical protein YC2023_012787 [Brassica napus]
MKQKLSSNAAAETKRVHKRKLSSTAAAAETKRVVGNVQMGNGLNKRGRLEISSSKSVSPEKRTTIVEASNKHDMDFQSNNAQKSLQENRDFPTEFSDYSCSR